LRTNQFSAPSESIAEYFSIQSPSQNVADRTPLEIAAAPYAAALEIPALEILSFALSELV
jgi:hypothetical protein